MLPEELDRLHRKIHLAQLYKDWTNSEVGQDLLKFLNLEFTEAQNQILLEQDDRSGKAGTDTLRGRMQILSKLYNYVNYAIQDGINSEKRIAKDNQKP